MFKLRREVFCFLLLIVLLTGALMSSRISEIRQKGVKSFSIMQLELPDSAIALQQTVGLLKEKKSISAVQSNLYIDYIFMIGAYAGIMIWLIIVASGVKKKIRTFLLLIAALQLVAWLIDINENIKLLGYIDDGNLRMRLRLFKVLVYIKFIIAGSGLLTAAIVFILKLRKPTWILQAAQPVILPVSRPFGWRPFPDYRIGELSAMGFLGLFTGFFVLAWHDITLTEKEKTYSSFHEVVYQPAPIVASAFLHVIDSLKNRIARSTTDSLIKKTLDADTTLKNRLSGFQKYYEQSDKVDSLGFTKLNQMLRFNITLNNIRQWDAEFRDSAGDKWEKAITYNIKVPATEPFFYNGITTFRINRPDSDMAFSAKYPAVGSWVLFLLVFCSFCFVAISTCIYFKNQVLGIFEVRSIDGPSKFTFYLIWAIVLLAFLILQYLWRRSFNDEEMIKEIYFMTGFTSAMHGIMTIGYITGAACLAGFIHTASMLGYFARIVKDKKDIVSQQAQIAQNAPAGSMLASQEEAKLVEQKAAMEMDAKIYEQLQKYFNNYFLLSGAILSLMVLCTGALFSTVNSLEFVKLLADDWGFSPARPEYIYLYGGLHTLILLMVYIPAKMSFSETNIQQGSTVPEDAATKTKWTDILKNPFGRFSEILVAVSPLLTGILQSVFELIFR